MPFGHSILSGCGSCCRLHFCQSFVSRPDNCWFRRGLPFRHSFLPRCDIRSPRRDCRLMFTNSRLCARNGCPLPPLFRNSLLSSGDRCSLRSGHDSFLLPPMASKKRGCFQTRAQHRIVHYRSLADNRSPRLRSPAPPTLPGLPVWHWCLRHIQGAGAAAGFAALRGCATRRRDNILGSQLAATICRLALVRTGYRVRPEHPSVRLLSVTLSIDHRRSSRRTSCR